MSSRYDEINILMFTNLSFFVSLLLQSHQLQHLTPLPQVDRDMSGATEALK